MFLFNSRLKLTAFFRPQRKEPRFTSDGLMSIKEPLFSRVSHFYRTSKASQTCPSPALFGDDHFCLMAVEFEPQRPVAEIHLSSESRPGKSHGPDAGPGALVRVVSVSRTVSKLIARAELAASRAQSLTEARGRQHRAVVQRCRVP